MKIYEDSILKFGKHQGKSFMDILIADIDYLRFLYRKGFDFNANCRHFILDGFDIENEIRYEVRTKTDKLKFYSVQKLICRAEKGKRRKDLVKKKKNDFIKYVSLEKIPFIIEEKEITSNHFDSTAFQSDDRFFTSTSIQRTKIYDAELLSETIKSNLKQLETTQD